MFGVDNYTPYVKDAFHRYVINNENDAIKPDGRGTKVAGLYVLNLGPGESFKIKIKLDNRSNCDEFEGEDVFSEQNFDQVVKERISDADEFYSKVLSGIFVFHVSLSNLRKI